MHIWTLGAYLGEQDILTQGFLCTEKRPISKAWNIVIFKAQSSTYNLHVHIHCQFFSAVTKFSMSKISAPTRVALHIPHTICWFSHSSYSGWLVFPQHFLITFKLLHSHVLPVVYVLSNWRFVLGPNASRRKWELVDLHSRAGNIISSRWLGSDAFKCRLPFAGLLPTGMWRLYN